MTIAARAIRPDWTIVALLWGAFFLNQADRQVYNVVLPLIKADLQLSNEALGLVATIFTLVYGLLVPFAGIAGDAFSRRWVVVASLVVFSAGTLSTAFASSFLTLLIFRGVATGAGEAFYAPAASALIAETHVTTRARALAIHQTANYTGIVLGSLITGWIAQQFGWRASFLFYGALGLTWAALIAMVVRRTPAAPGQSVPLASRLAALSAAVRYVLTKPILLAQMVAFGGLVFGLTGFLTWTPTLLHERFGLSIAEAGFSAVFYHHLLAYLSLMAASTVTDLLVARFPQVRLLSMGVALALCGPAIAFSASADGLWPVYVGFAAYGAFRGVYDAGLFAAVFDEVDDALRASVIGLLLAAGFLIGSISPLLMGALKASYGLEMGLYIVALVQVVAGAVLIIATLSRKQSTFA